MSSTTNSPLKRTSTEDIIAYVHDLSPVKRNRNNSMDYVTLTLQTSKDETREALLYSPQKRKLFAQSLESRTPIKLKNVAFTKDRKKIVVNDMTYVTSPKPTEYHFQYAELLPKNDETPVSILEILNSGKEWDTVSVKGKIVQLNEMAIVGAKNLKLCEAVLADNTAKMPFDIWESQIPEFSLGSVYDINQVQIRVWSGTKKISTLVKTSAHKINDESLQAIPLLNELGDSTEHLSTETIKEFTRIESYEKFLKCIKCHRRIQGNTASKIVKCQRCGIMKTEKCEFGLTLKVNVEIDGLGERTLKIGDEILSKLLNEEVLSMDEDNISELLLFKDSTKLTFNTNTYVVTDV